MAVLLDLGIQQRQGTLSYDQWVVPETGSVELLIRPQVHPTDFVDPSKSLEMIISVWRNGDGVWVQKARGTWVGHPEANINDPDQVPSFGVTFADGERGSTVRGEMHIPVRMRVGVIVETI